MRPVCCSRSHSCYMEYNCRRVALVRRQTRSARVVHLDNCRRWAMERRKDRPRRQLRPPVRQNIPCRQTAGRCSRPHHRAGNRRRCCRFPAFRAHGLPSPRGESGDSRCCHPVISALASCVRFPRSRRTLLWPLRAQRKQIKRSVAPRSSFLTRLITRNLSRVNDACLRTQAQRRHPPARSKT